MRILFTAFDVVPAPKGASVRIQEMLKALSSLGEVRAYVLGEPDYREREVTPEGVEILRMCSPQDSFLERSVLFAEQVLAGVLNWRPDVVQFRSLWDAYPLLRFFERHPQLKRPLFIYELHGLPEFELEHHFPELPAGLKHKIQLQQRRVFQEVDAIVCPSQVHLQYLEREVQPRRRSPAQTAWVPNGVDLTAYQQTPPPRPEGPPLILYVGTLAPWQGLETLLEALAGVVTPFRLRLIGKGQRRWVQNLLTRAFQLKLSARMELLDPLPHDCMPAAIQAADICVAPLDRSQRNIVQGCMPLKILEYMAAGQAIVASDLEALRPLLNEENALLVPAEDPQALQQALTQLLEDVPLRQQLGAAAYESVQGWTWTQMQDKLRALYHVLHREREQHS